MAAGRMPLRYAKLVCGGNDFIIVDSRNDSPPADLPALTRAICDRRNGVGADGLICLVSHGKHPFAILLYNEDGSRAQVSYNGSRCVGLYAVREGIAPASFTFASDAGPVGVEVVGREVTLSIPPAGRIAPETVTSASGEQVRGVLADVGIPYFVVFSDDLDCEWVERVCPGLKTNSAFPEGANIAVAEPPDGSGTRSRFFERGVEEETPSSGSGCVAVALACAQSRGSASPFTVQTGGGDFAVSFERDGDSFSGIVSAGEVGYICRGELVD